MAALPYNGRQFVLFTSRVILSPVNKVINQFFRTSRTFGRLSRQAEEDVAFWAQNHLHTQTLPAGKQTPPHTAGLSAHLPTLAENLERRSISIYQELRQAKIGGISQDDRLVFDHFPTFCPRDCSVRHSVGWPADPSLLTTSRPPYHHTTRQLHNCAGTRACVF